MMTLSFAKYHGTGNDFILIDNRARSGFVPLHFSRERIAELCHRRYGIGADGFILLASHPEYDFQMMNYNSDGGECSMCGNGGRTLVQFASDLGIQKEHYRFLAVDGPHEAIFRNQKIELKMQDVIGLAETPVGTALDTGSPHLVIEKNGLLDLDAVTEGRHLRNSSLFQPRGINVNFTESRDGHLFVRTYERGVEDETLSCGTGAIASAIVSVVKKPQVTFGSHEIPVQTPGGKLVIRFTQTGTETFSNIWLIGEAKRSFQGQVKLT